jgi:hypothetical protein
VVKFGGIGLYPPAGLVVLRNLRNMRNPFEYGGVVSGEAFCNREKETRDLVRAMENGG